MQALDAAYTKNALQPVMLDIAEVSSYANFLLICSGRSVRQVEAIAEAVVVELKAKGHTPMGVEGGRGARWTLVDYGDVVVHVFYHPARKYYDMEGLWSEAPRVELDVPEELQVVELDDEDDYDLDDEY